MNTITKDDVEKYLTVCMMFSMGIEKIVANNYDETIMQGVVATILMEMGYDEVKSQAAAITMGMLSFTKVLKEADNVIVGLSSLVNTASNAILSDQIPEYVIEQVKVSLRQNAGDKLHQ